MSNLWKIVITAVVAIIIAGGGTYYIMQKEIDKVKSDNDTQISDLNKKITDLSQQLADAKKDPALDASAPTTTPVATTSWKNYTNSKYGFSLTFNDLWKNFEVVEKASDDVAAAAYLYVCVPTTTASWKDEKAGMFCPLAITVVAKANKASFEAANDPQIPTFLSEGAAYDFYYSGSQANPDDGVTIRGDVKNIVATFKAN